MSEEVGKADLSSIIADIDRLVHEPARLAVMSLLYVVDSADFTFIMNQTDLTWGNLSAHISKLETAGYVEVEKMFVDKIPRTLLRLTKEGREALQSYRKKMRRVFEDLPE